MESLGKPGGPGGNRTPDALLRTEALYPLSYEAVLEHSLHRSAQTTHFATPTQPSFALRGPESRPDVNPFGESQTS